MTKPNVGLSMLHMLSRPFKEMVTQVPHSETTYIEIVDDGLHALNKRRVSILKDIAASYDLKYSVHAPFSDLNIASPSKVMLNAALRRMKTSLASASALNASVWVFHPGTRTGISQFYPGEDWRQNLKTSRRILRTAQDFGVAVGIENVPEPFPFLMKSVEDFTRFYAEVDADIGFVLDVGHANINKQTADFLTTFKDRVIHIHASDNDGEEDQHLGICDGTADWETFARLLRKIAYDRTVIVESVDNASESVQRLGRLLS
jgi:sugar phosphate isomerase/epimerase